VTFNALDRASCFESDSCLLIGKLKPLSRQRITKIDAGSIAIINECCYR